MKLTLSLDIHLLSCHYFTEEEISSPQLIADLADRDADAPIFGKLGFTYGKAARFKQEFEMKKTSRSSGHARPCSPAPSKPTMAEMSNFTPEMKRLYLSKYAMGLIDHLMSCYAFSISFEILCTYQRKSRWGKKFRWHSSRRENQFWSKVSKNPPWGVYSVINTQMFYKCFHVIMDNGHQVYSHLNNV